MRKTGKKVGSGHRARKGNALKKRDKALSRYRAKRHFEQTPEPGPRARARSKGNSFVVQKHDARRLHYDFRLEMDGVLKSWAVTKGPSLEPADRRLAVHVEDHPIAYGGFEGIIPPNQYGAGTVMLWDRGTWAAKSDNPQRDYARGKLEFTLSGEHMQGAWLLVRMGGKAAAEKRDNWLLIKGRDEFAAPGQGNALVNSVQRSVLSGKTMEQLAATGRAWQSNRGKSSKAKKPAKPAIAQTSSPTLARRVAKLSGVKKGSLPDFVAPELATLVARPPSSGNWLHEIKIDGYRAYCRRDGDEVRFLTRAGNDWTDRFSSLIDPIKALPGKQLGLDGEVAVLDARGTSSFGALQDALSEGDVHRLCYIVFDLLYADGYDLRNVALIDRKRILQEVVPSAPAGGTVRFSDHIAASGRDVYQHACQMALEGIVSKRADLPYHSGRSGDWLKSKCIARQELVIGGHTLSKSGDGGLGALLLGYYEGRKLCYAGKVGTGFTRQQSHELRARLEKIAQPKCTFDTVPAEGKRGALWVRPILVCEVEFLSWTADGHLRHASFQGLREDKKAENVVREEPVQSPSGDDSKPARDISKGKQSARSGKIRQKRAVAKPGGRPVKAGKIDGIVITHPDRIVFSDVGLTKQDMADYYKSVAELMIPHIEDRPLSLLRCPSGTNECFYQKHFPTGVKSLARVPIKESAGIRQYVMVRSTADLIELIQEGVIEIHPWGARADNVERPDRLIFDLDPDPKVEWKRVVDTAVVMREHLEQMGLVSFAKTTGGKGLHVVVPLKRRLGWKEIKEFARAVAGSFAKASPSEYTVSPLKRNRTGKIFIDYLRNDRGSTAIAPYCARARSNAPVAMPVSWDEVTAKLDPGAFTVRSLQRQLAARRTDPWADMEKVEQSIPAEIRRAVVHAA